MGKRDMLSVSERSESDLQTQLPLKESVTSGENVLNTHSRSKSYFLIAGYVNFLTESR